MNDLPARDKLPTVRIVPEYDAWIFGSLFAAGICGAGFYTLARAFPCMLRRTPETAEDVGLQTFGIALGWGSYMRWSEHANQIKGAQLQHRDDEVILRDLIERKK